MEAATVSRAPSPQAHRLITNVLWSWTGVAASLFQGLVITRFLVRSLGAEQYGNWVLIFSILDYFWFFYGLNSAVANFCARFLVTDQPQKINEVISPSLFYFSLIGMCVYAIHGVYTPWLVSRALECSFLEHMAGIYVRPLLTAVPALSVAWTRKATVLPGRSWTELIVAGCATASVYLATAMLACIEPSHRALFVGRIPLVGPRLAPNRA